MKQIAISTVKVVVFFLGWAILVSVLPLSTSENPALWRLWAEAMPLLAIILFTAAFWLLEKRTVRLCLVGESIKEFLLGIIAGTVWLGCAVGVMCLLGVMSVEGENTVPMFSIWLWAAFFNVIMQELLVRGYLYQMLKQKHNIIAATVVTTAIFTACHGGAFEAGLVPVLNVVTMSLLMTVVLEYTGSLVAPIMMHFIWNGIGALILGGVPLADDYPNLLNSTFSGHKLLSGGDCKIEGSVVVLLLNILFIILFIVRDIQGWKAKFTQSCNDN